MVQRHAEHGVHRDDGVTPLRAAAVPPACGLAVIAIAGVGLTGRVLGEDSLRRVAPGLAPDEGLHGARPDRHGRGPLLPARGRVPALAPPGACSGWLVAAVRRARRRRVCSSAGSGSTSSCSADSGAALPWPPSPHTALAFIALGLALATVDARRRGRRLHAALTAVTAAVVLFAIVGYVFDVTYLRGLSGPHGRSRSTRSSRSPSLTVGLVCLRPGTGLAAMLRGERCAAPAWLARCCRSRCSRRSPSADSPSRAQESGVFGARVGALDRDARDDR